MTTINSKDPKLKQSIRQINGYVYVTDESEIKEGAWFIRDGFLQKATSAYKNHGADEKVILSTDKSIGVPVFKIQDEIEILINKAKADLKRAEDMVFGNGYIVALVKGKLEILNLWRDNPARWSDEDLKKAIDMARKKEIKEYVTPHMVYSHTVEEILQSLKPVIDSIDWEAERVEPLKQTISREFDEDDVILEVKIINNTVNAVKINWK